MPNSCNPSPSANSLNKISKNSALLKGYGAKHEPSPEPVQPPVPLILTRRNRLGELPVRVVICDRTGRGRAVYPGQSDSAAAARLGAVDWTSEPVGVRHG